MELEKHLKSKIIKFEEYYVTEEPFYIPVRNEIEIFEAAYKSKIPVILKGPTGCGKTRFLQYMAWKLKRPLITVACHEDLTASDLIGRYIIKGGETVWIDGPLTRAVKIGAICYLDEIVEARKDTIVVIHPLTDDRRILPVEKRGEIIKAPDEFMLVMSYNPRYQSALKELKQSTKQRFIAIDFDWPPKDIEKRIIMHEAKIDEETAETLVEMAQKVRALRDKGLDEGVSTRLLVYAANLIREGVEPIKACEVSIANILTDDPELRKAIMEIVKIYF